MKINRIFKNQILDFFVINLKNIILFHHKEFFINLTNQLIFHFVKKNFWCYHLIFLTNFHFIGFFLAKLLRQMYHGVAINKDGIAKVCNLKNLISCE